MEQTLIILKPDALQRQLCGEILGRFERRGFVVRAMKMMMVPRDLAEKHYAEHQGKAFYPSLCDFITSGPVVVLVLEADQAVELARGTIGATDPRQATPGSIRGDLTCSLQRNLVHGSDSAASAERELRLWFPEFFTGP